MTLNTLVSFALLAAGMARAQAPEAPKTAEASKFYKLEFVVKEVEAGKVLNARTYSLTTAIDPKWDSASIRTGSKVPVPTGSGAAPFSQYQYIDVGVNIDCRGMRELQRDLSLFVVAEVSSVPLEAEAATPAAPAPRVIRQNKWSSLVTVPLKKPTLIFSSDDPASKRQVQLELTATPLQ